MLFRSPFCKKEQPKEPDFRNQVTVSAYQLTGEHEGQEDRETVWLKNAGKRSENEDDKTVGIYSRFTGNDFVTGWLVCTKGAERGRDYRLHYGFNRIGRGLMMDVCILEDEMISRNMHCSVVYGNDQKDRLPDHPHGSDGRDRGVPPARYAVRHRRPLARADARHRRQRRPHSRGDEIGRASCRERV